jgi:hypothetical protein
MANKTYRRGRGRGRTQRRGRTLRRGRGRSQRGGAAFAVVKTGTN